MATLDSDVPMLPAGESSNSSAASSSTKKPKRFEIKKWSAVALWAWISLWIIVRFAGITSWIYVLNAKQTKPAPPVRNAPLLGGSATMHFTSTVSADG